MELERIVGKQYNDFIRQKDAAIVLTLSYCEHCQDYKSDVLMPAAELFKEVRFGEAVMDFCNLIPLKKDLHITPSNPEYYPHTVFFKDGAQAGFLGSTKGKAPTLEQLVSALTAIYRS